MVAINFHKVGCEKHGHACSVIKPLKIENTNKTTLICADCGCLMGWWEDIPIKGACRELTKSEQEELK